MGRHSWRAKMTPRINLDNWMTFLAGVLTSVSVYVLLTCLFGHHEHTDIHSIPSRISSDELQGSERTRNTATLPLYWVRSRSIFERQAIGLNIVTEREEFIEQASRWDWLADPKPSTVPCNLAEGVVIQ